MTPHARSPRAWLLNFDADEELARPDGPRKLPPSRALACRLLRARALLVPRGDRLIDEPGPAPTRVLTWMPTRRALALLHARGLPVPSAPTFPILRVANSRRFSAALGAGPAGTRWVESEDDARHVLATGDHFLLRTAHGFAGRGRWFGQRDDPTTLRFIQNALDKDGGLEIAPRVSIELEVAMHGFLAADGALTLGRPTRSHVDAQGQWRRTSMLRDELSVAELDALADATERAATALRTLGYFGPFGVDAFRAREAGFCPLSEINARYTMAWGRGMSGRRVDLC